ncbi:MAG: hypothetical protein ACREQ9_01330 [Candidatus Binatia bacterium]
MRDSIPKLSKSRFMAGLQCHKRLYLESYARELADPVDPLTQAVLDAGSRIGAAARQRFAGGLLITEPHGEHEEAERKTRRALAEPSLPVIYEAAFTSDDIRIRADILARSPQGPFDVVEVKSSASLRLEHEWDVAVQLRVLEGADVPIRSAFLMHLNRDYVHPGGDYDLEGLFTLADVTETARARQKDVASALAEMRAPLRSEAPPEIEVGAHCESWSSWRPADAPARRSASR